MANFIPEDTISEIKHAADIVDVVSDVVLLKKAGRNFIGLCPFHVEKTPSFTVSPEKQIFYCFGCGTTGNVFTFLMKREGFSFPEAVRFLARRYGVEIPASEMTPEQRKRIGERENLLGVNRQAMDYYRQRLHDPSMGKKAMEYLKKRGVIHEIIDRFQLGYAPEGWDNLASRLFQNQIAPSTGERAGLVIPRKSKSGFYDRFRDRLIFPIFNIGNQVIGFGGRVLDDSLPKYLNSPETMIFNKSKSLYGFNLAKSTCRETQTAYIVEGYFDVLALHQHGIPNSVATLGTSLTREHVQLVRGAIGDTGKIILVFDSDDAGLKAAIRSIDLLEKGYVDARILVLDAGHDPDSYLFKFGREKFLSLSDRALSAMSFLIDSAVKVHGLSNEGKIRIISDLKEPFLSIQDSVARSIYLKELSERTGIDEKPILEEIEKVAKGRRIRDQKHTGYNHSASRDASTADMMKTDKAGTNSASESKIERRIISMMLQYPEIVSEIRKRNLIDVFESNPLKSVGRLILKNWGDTHGEISSLLEMIDDGGVKSEIAFLAIQEDVWDRDGCLRLISQYETSRRRREKYLLEQIKAAEANNDRELLAELLRKKQNLARKRI